MTDVVETIEYKGHKIEIKTDEHGYSPRENDNICEFHCSHRRYELGDKGFNYLDGQECIEEVNERKRQGDIVLPLYLYDHSGISISLSNAHYPFNCPWDSGQVGFVVVSREKMLENWGNKIFTRVLKIKALEVAQGEVKEYDAYLRGEVYGFVIDDGDGDSCWGYIGDIADVIEEAKEAVDHIVLTA
jgi:hypothetical protein